MPSLTKVQSGFMEAQGALPLSPGTAAAPGLKFDDHAGTGMFSPSTGEIAFSTSGHSQSVTFKTDGKVGIGTANPVGNLEVRDSKANLIVAKDGLTVKSNSDLHTSYDMLQIGAGGALASYSVETATADTQLIHNAYRHSGGTFKYRYADTAMRLRMNSPGGAFIFESAANGSADGDITFSEKLRISSIGAISASSATTTTPLVTLTNSSVAATHGEVLKLVTGRGGNVADIGVISVHTNDGEIFRVQNDGKVGIGETDPDNLLHIKSTASPAIELEQDGGTSYKGLIKLAGNDLEIKGSNGQMEFYNGSQDGDSSTLRMVIQNSGRIHLGTRDGNQNSTVFGVAKVNIVGPDPIPTSFTAGGCYLQIGGTESELNGLYPIGFGFRNSTGTHVPAYIAYKTIDSGANEHGDLLFATRNVTTDTEPTERLRITSTGDLALGTNNPAAGATGGYDRVFNIQAGSSSALSSISFGDGNATGRIESVNGNNGKILINGSEYIAFGTSGTPEERLRITSAGQMGLGANNPGDYDAEANDFVVRSANHTGITIASSGSNQRCNLYFSDGTSGSEKYRGAFTYDHSDDSMMMRTAGVERLRLTSDAILKLQTSGNTVDGTYYSSFTINNTGSSTWSRLRFDRSGSARWGLALSTNDTFRISNLNLSGGGGADDACFVINNSSNIGIQDATPSYRLDVNGSVRAQETGNGKGLLLHTNSGLSATANLMQIWTGQNNGISFHTSNSSGDQSNERLRITSDGVVNTRRLATGERHNSPAYRPHQLGYMGDYFPYGCNAVYYLAQTSTGNSGYSSHMFSWYDSGHWGHYGKFVLFCQEASYIGGFAHRYLSGTTVNTIVNGGQGGSVSTTQTQTGSGTHSGQSVHRYDCTISHSGTYRTYRWYLGLLHGCSSGVTGSGKTQAQAQTYANSNGSLLHLFGVSDSNLTMAPNYRTW